MGNPYFEVSGQLAENIVASLGTSVPTWAVILFFAIVFWSTVWKLFGLWKSARRGSILWFVVLAITNTLGILPILYVFIFSETKKRTRSKEIKNTLTKIKRKK
jgi:hypothetical protein